MRTFVGVRSVVTLMLIVLLAGCGFQLRAPRPLPFDSLYIAMPENSGLAIALRRAIRASSANTKLAEKAADAEAVLTPTLDTREKNVLSLNAAGRVREYQIKRRFSFRLHDKEGRDLAPTSEIVVTRDFTYSDSRLLGKDQEEELLNNDMQNDVVQQVLRRLQAAKPVVAAPAG